MGRLSGRSGLVGLVGFPSRVDSELKEALEKARFAVVNGLSPNYSDAEQAPDAVVLWAEDELKVSTELQRLQFVYPHAALVALIDGRRPNASLVMLSAFRNGAVDAEVATALADFSSMIVTLKNALERNRLATESRSLAHSYTHELGARARSLIQANDDIEGAYEETLLALVAALDVREKATAGHSLRVAYYSCHLALKLGIEGAALKDVYRGALLHDIGKIGIPDSILLKPGKLSDEEFTVMRRHTVLAKRFLQDIPYLAKAIEIPYSHHERWDGGGYPQGLAGESIPLAARIFAVVDVYDALRSERSYKEAYSHKKSKQIILTDAGSHFDPKVVNLFATESETTWFELDEASRRAGSSYESMIEECKRIANTRTVINERVNPLLVCESEKHFQELFTCLNGNSDDLSKVVEQIHLMPSVAVEVMALANDSILSGESAISSLERGVTLIGRHGIDDIARELLTRKFHSQNNSQDYMSLESFRRRSAAISIAAGLVAKAAQLPFVAEARAAGLLHDMGMLIQNDLHPESFALACQESRETGTRLVEHEYLHCGIDHAELGGDQAEAMGLSPILVSTLTFHHDPLNAPRPFRFLAMVVYAAECLARRAGIPDPNGEAQLLLEDKVLLELRLSQEQFNDQAEFLRKELVRSSLNINCEVIFVKEEPNHEPEHSLH